MNLSFTDILENYLKDTEGKLLANYNNIGLRASGDAENTNTVITRQGDSVHAAIEAPLQWYFMENGRKPNKNPSKGQIYFLSEILKDWQKAKGIAINTWLAATKIVNEGIKVPNKHNPGGVISNVINDTWMSELNKKLSFAVIDSYKTIIKSWQS